MMRGPLFGVLLFLAAGCSQSSAPLVIGHVAPFTGSDKDIADQAANGIRLAVEDYAAQKPARPVVVRHADDKGDLDAAEGQAVRLVTLNRSLALLGGVDALEAARLDRAGSLLLSPIGQRAKSMSDFTIVTGLSPERLGKALASYLNDTIKPSATALFVEPGDDASAMEAAFLAAWAEAKRPAPARQELGDPASDTVKKWAEALPKDVLPIFIASPAALKTLALETALRDRPLAFLGPEIARRPLKERTAPLFLVTAFGVDGKAAEFADRYAAKFQTAAEPHAALAYDDTRLLLEILKKGLIVPKTLRDELNALKEFSGLTGTYKIAEGIVERPAFVGRLEKGRLVAAK
jgi:ABC-type branched-subunit amino acid transport system substrate-binding protein